jgi:hypothetical protein
MEFARDDQVWKNHGKNAGSVELHPWAVRQRRRTVAPADAAGCRAYEERFWRAMIRHERNRGKT